MLFRKISNFTSVATTEGNALEKLFQLGVPRLIFQNKTLLTEVLVGSSSMIPEPACTPRARCPGKQKPNSRSLFTQLGTTTLTTHARCHPGKGQTELFQDKVLLPHYALQKEEIIRINTSQI